MQSFEDVSRMTLSFLKNLQQPCLSRFCQLQSKLQRRVTVESCSELRLPNIEACFVSKIFKSRDLLCHISGFVYNYTKKNDMTKYRRVYMRNNPWPIDFSTRTASKQKKYIWSRFLDKLNVGWRPICNYLKI